MLLRVKGRFLSGTNNSEKGRPVLKTMKRVGDHHRHKPMQKRRISEILDQDRRKTLREISAESRLSCGTCQQTVTGDLAMK